MKARIFGIYQILNTITGKSYIGSSVNIYGRWKNHKNELKRNKHGNSKLQRAWNKYGSEVWEWKILRECGEFKLDWLEAFWMDSLNSVQNGYNLNILKLRNRVVSEETRAKLRGKRSEETIAKMKGRGVSEETKQKIGNAKREKPISENTLKALRNRVISEETRRKIGESGRGRKLTEEQLEGLHTRVQSEETRRKRSESLKGGVFSEETLKRMSLAQIGKSPTKETLKKLKRPESESHKAKMKENHKGMIGKKHSEETLEKMRLAYKQRKLNHASQN